MKRGVVFISVVVVLVAAGVLVWMVLQPACVYPPPPLRAQREAAAAKLSDERQSGSRPAAGSPSQTPPSSSAPTTTSTPAVAVAPVPAAKTPARQYVHEDSPAHQEAEAIALNLRHYGQRFGGNPVGTNAEIVQVLNGGNPQHAKYLPQEHLRLNEQGELLDSFGTPYFFHQISAEEMEVRSAGPDKTLWTADDIAVK